MRNDEFNGIIYLVCAMTTMFASYDGLLWFNNSNDGVIEDSDFLA